MNTFKFIGIPSLLLVTMISFLLPSCVFFHDTVAFNALGKMPAVKTPVPKVEIDTKITQKKEVILNKVRSYSH